MSSPHSHHRAAGHRDGNGAAFGQPLTDTHGQPIDYGLDDMDLDHNEDQLPPTQTFHANSSDDSDSDSDGDARIRRRKRPRRRFGDSDDDDNSSSDDRDRDRRARQRGDRSHGRSGTYIRGEPAPPRQPPGSSTNAAASPQSSTTTPPVPKSFGQFAGTGGLGLKLLMKMGYTPGQGLGAQGQGIVEPVQAIMRPKGAGISIDEDYTEPAPPASKAKQPQEPEVALELDSLRFAKATKPDQSPRQLSRRKRMGKRRNKYKKQARQGDQDDEDEQDDAMDVDDPSSTPATIDIVDLRGASLATTSPYLSSPAVLHLFDSLAASTTQTQSKLLARKAQRTADQAKLETIGRQLDEARQHHQEQAARLQQIHTLADRIRAISNDLAGDDDQEDAWLDVVKDATEFSSIFAPAIASVAVAKLRPRLSSNDDWNPISDPARCASQLSTVRQATSASLTPHGGTFYDALLWTAWVPRVRLHLQSLSDWLASFPAAHQVVDALTHWSAAVLSPALHAHMVHQICVPRIRRALDTSSPASHAHDPAQPVLGFLLPWFLPSSSSPPLLPPPADTFLPGLTYKLGATIDHVLVRHPHDPHNRLAGLPPTPCLDAWPAQLSPAAWSALVARHLAPALVAHVRECVRVDPAAQDPRPVDALLAYIPLVGSGVVARAVAEGGMMREWARVAYAWARAIRSAGAEGEQHTGAARAGELAAWWRVWRTYIPAEVWADPAVRRYLGAGLMVLRAVASGQEQVPDPDVLVSKADAVEGRGRPARPQVQAQTWQPTIKDLVTRECERVGLGVEPVGKTLARVARPVYRVVADLGGKGRKATRAYVYWDQDVVFVRQAGVEGGVDENENVVSLWDPMAIKDIVDMCTL